GKAVFSAINLPIPVILDRWQPGQKSFISGGVLVGAAPGSSAVDAIFSALKAAPEAAPAVLANSDNADDLQKQAAAAGLDASNYTPTREDDSTFKGLVFDATGIESPEQLKTLWAFFQPVIK